MIPRVATMSEQLTFKTAGACIDDLERKVARRPYGSAQRPGQRQVQCARCMRWKYADERCNLFMHSGSTGVEESSDNGGAEHG